MTPEEEAVLTNQIADLDKQIGKFGSNPANVCLKSIATSLFEITLLLARIDKKS